MIVQMLKVRIQFVQRMKSWGVAGNKKSDLMPPRPLSRSIGATQKYFGKKHGEVNG